MHRPQEISVLLVVSPNVYLKTVEMRKCLLEA